MARFEIKAAGETVIFITHERPHLDEITAKWLIEKFGKKYFLDKYAPKRILEAGINGGPFDEHAGINGKIKESECAATLVAKALGVDNDPALKIILKSVLNSDLKSDNHHLDIASVVKSLYLGVPNNPEKVISWATAGLEAIYQEQVKFFATKREFEKNAQKEEVLGPNKQTLKMVTIVSDNEQINKFARSSIGGGAAIVIQQRLSGNVQIYTNKIYGLTLNDVARMINLAEQKAEGEVKINDWKLLSAEGKIPNGRWFFYSEGQMLLNGSLSYPDIPPTGLKIELIKKMVRIGINPEVFETSFAAGCLKGICYSHRSSKCPWYKWGLQRCRKIRYNMKNPSRPLGNLAMVVR